MSEFYEEHEYTLTGLTGTIEVNTLDEQPLGEVGEDVAALWIDLVLQGHVKLDMQVVS